MAAETKFLGMDSSQIPMFSALVAILAISLTTLAFLIAIHFSMKAHINAVRADGVAFREKLPATTRSAPRQPSCARRWSRTTSPSAKR